MISLQDCKDSFTVGTPATGGSIKVYFEGEEAQDKIKKAKELYYQFVELDRIRKEGMKR